VFKREELYEGPYLESAPDLIIEWADYGYWGNPQFEENGQIFELQRHFDYSDQPLTGSHRLDGIVILNGAEIAPEVELTDASLVDMAPTILSLLGIAPLQSMDGRLLEEALTPEGKERIQQRAQAGEAGFSSDEYAYDAEMEEKISEHLRSLGYL
jgi:predicted AlkP superfamily phosphohydrolase/phosphomutase